MKIKAQIPTGGSKLTRFLGRALGLASSVVAGKATREKALADARTQLDRMSEPPTDWLPYLRRQTRLNLWYKATVKAWLKATGLPKPEKAFLRARFLQGHWDRPQLTPDGVIKAHGAAARKRRQKSRRIHRAQTGIGETIVNGALLA